MIRDDVSSIIGVRIFGTNWKKYIEPLDKEGKFSRKTMLDIVMALCVELEKVELDLQMLKKPENEVPSVFPDGKTTDITVQPVED